MRRTHKVRGYGLFDRVGGDLRIREDATTMQPLVFRLTDLQEGRVMGEPCALPEISGRLALDFETMPRPEWAPYFEKVAGLDPHLGQVRLIQVSDGEHAWLVDAKHVDGWQDWLARQLVRADEVLAHNARFEAKFVAKEIGRLPVAWRCTQIASQLIGYHHPGHSLAAVVKRWLAIDLPKEQQKSDWSRDPLTAAQVEYAMGDVTWMHQLYARLLEKLDESGQTFLYHNIECASLGYQAEVEMTGMPVDTNYTKTYVAKLAPQIEDQRRRVAYLLTRLYKEQGDYSRLTDGLWVVGIIPDGSRLPPPEDFTLDSLILGNSAHVLQILYALGLEIKDCQKSTLATIKAQGERVLDGRPVNVVGELLSFRLAEKRLEFGVKLDTPWTPLLPPNTACRHPVTDRLHTEFKLLVTGRMQSGSGTGGEEAGEDSASKVNKSQPWLANLQNFPRTSDIRRAFGFTGCDGDDDHACVALAGWDEAGVPQWEWSPEHPIRAGMHRGEPWVLLGADYSALEACILAHLCRDASLIRSIMGEDFHSYNASVIFNVPISQVTKPMRQICKNAWYCLSYGGGAAKIAELVNVYFAENNIPESTTVAYCDQARNGLLSMYPGIDNFMTETKAYVLGNPQWATPPTKFGRVRLLKPEIERDRTGDRSPVTKAMNQPMQGTNADVLKLAIRYLSEDVVPFCDRQNIPLELGTPVHDELLLMTPLRCAHLVAPPMAAAMNRAVLQVLSDEQGNPTFGLEHIGVLPSFGPTWAQIH